MENTRVQRQVISLSGPASVTVVWKLQKTNLSKDGLMSEKHNERVQVIL